MARGSEEHPRGKSPLALVRTWRARDCHTGIGRGQGIPYTYRHVEATPEAAAEVYRIETFIPFTDRPIHRNEHYVPAAKLDSFFDLWGARRDDCGHSPTNDDGRARGTPCVPDGCGIDQVIAR